MKKMLLTGLALGLGLGVAAAVNTPARADITIAVAGPITGQYASFGAQMKAGAEQAVADINKNGGILGQKLILEVGDDACDAKQAVAVANQLATKGVLFVAGHFCSSTSIPAAKVYAEEGIIQITPASTNPKLTDERAGPNIFRVCGRDDQQGKVAGQLLASRYKGKNIAIIHDKTAYGKGLADETRKALHAAGGREVLYEAYTAGEKDYTALVSKLKQNRVAALYVGGYHTEAGLIVRQMRDQGMNTVLIAGDALVTQEYWSITGKAGEGTLMTFSPDPRKNPIAKPLVKIFRDKNIEPEGYVLYTYAAVQVWADAVKRAGSPNPQKLIKELNTREFNTVLGKLRFNKKGDVSLPGYVFYQWKNGTYDYLSN